MDSEQETSSDDDEDGAELSRVSSSKSRAGVSDGDEVGSALAEYTVVDGPQFEDMPNFVEGWEDSGEVTVVNQPSPSSQEAER